MEPPIVVAVNVQVRVQLLDELRSVRERRSRAFFIRQPLVQSHGRVLVAHQANRDEIALKRNPVHLNARDCEDHARGRTVVAENLVGASRHHNTVVQNFCVIDAVVGDPD